jgi:F-type H+-transporting ATPase subunit b
VTKARRIALALMLFVTAWSVWAVARAKGPSATVAETVAIENETEGAQSAGAAEHGEGEAGPAPINWADFHSSTPPYVAMLINFALLLGGYYFFGRKPIAAALQSRSDTIARDIKDAERMLAEAKERAKVYQAKVDELEQAKRLAHESLVSAGEAERDRIVAEAEAKAERMRRDSEFLIEQELKQIRENLVRDTVEAAVTAAEELLKSRITDADQQRLADEYLADLGKNVGARS